MGKDGSCKKCPEYESNINKYQCVQPLCRGPNHIAKSGTCEKCPEYEGGCPEDPKNCCKPECNKNYKIMLDASC